MYIYLMTLNILLRIEILLTLALALYILHNQLCSLEP